MQQVKRLVMCGVVVGLLALIGPARAGDEKWRQDPVPKIQAVWDKVSAARARLAELEGLIKREDYLVRTERERLVQAQVALAELETLIAHLELRLERMRKKRAEVEAERIRKDGEK